MEQTNVLDTNVLAVANKKADHVSNNCIFESQKLLNGIVQHVKKVSIDNQMLILNEYKNYANFSGQPNVGDIFFKWLFSNFGNTNICEIVPITLTNAEDILFQEIPNNLEGLERFDRADQKFLAVAFGSQYNVEIFEAADTDWNVLPQTMDKRDDKSIRIQHICT